MQAMAIDIRMPGIPTAQLRDAALARCIVVVSATTQLRISCTLTLGASGARTWAPDLRVGLTFSQASCQFGIVSVNVIGEMDFTVFVGKRRPVNDEDRDGLRQAHGDIVLSTLHAFLHFFQCPAGIIL